MGEEERKVRVGDWIKILSVNGDEKEAGFKVGHVMKVKCTNDEGDVWVWDENGYGGRCDCGKNHRWTLKRSDYRPLMKDSRKYEIGQRIECVNIHSINRYKKGRVCEPFPTFESDKLPPDTVYVRYDDGRKGRSTEAERDYKNILEEPKPMPSRGLSMRGCTCPMCEKGRTGREEGVSESADIKIKSKQTIMRKLSNFIKKSVDADTQELLKAGFINGDLEPTSTGEEELKQIQWFANLPALVARAKELNAEAEKESKE